MRIIGHIDHDSLKITIFKMDNKLSAKFENGLFEQTYKFRTSDGLETFEDIKKLIDQKFIDQVLEQMINLNQIRNQAFSRYFSVDSEEEFEEII